jgi:hypothetical protein
MKDYLAIGDEILLCGAPRQARTHCQLRPRAGRLGSPLFSSSGAERRYLGEIIGTCCTSFGSSRADDSGAASHLSAAPGVTDDMVHL